MPIYSVQGPDGRIYDIEGPAGASDAQVINALKNHLAQTQEEAPKPKTGIGAAVGKGVESLISSGRTAIGALTGDAEEAARAGLERGKKLGEKYEDQVSLQRVKDAYNKDGLLSAAGEVASQIPAAIAEQAPNLAAMAGSARLGAMAGSALGPAGTVAGTVIGGAFGKFAPAYVQQLGGDIERQAAEGVPINVGRAALAAAPQAALDAASMNLTLGGRLVQKLTGVPTAAFFSKSAAQAEKIANERLLTTLAKGTAVGALAEIPTEITQQMLERAQAGLSLTSPDALKEYGETAYQVGLLAPLGAVGRLSERGGARMDVAARQQTEATQAAELQQQQEAAAAQQKQIADADPAYAAKLRADYVAANVEMQRLNDVVKQVSAEKDPLSVADAKDARKARDAYAKETMQPLVNEIRRVRELHPTVSFKPAAPAAPAAVATATPAPEAPVVPVAPAPTTVTPMPEVAAAPLTKAQAAEGTVSEPAPFTAPAAAAPARMEEIQSHVEAIMGSPEVAAEMVANNEQVPGLTPEENALFLEMLQQRLAQEELTGEVAVPAGAEVTPAKKAKGKKAAAPVVPAAPAAPAAPAVEDTTVEPTEPRTLDQSFLAMDRTPEEPVPEIPAGSQYMIPGAAPLKRTRAVQTQELTQEIQTELKQLSKSYIAARQEGRRADALEIIDRMRYLKEQGKAAEVRPVLEGAASTDQSETIETKTADRTSPRALQQDIARAQALPNLSETHAELLDKLQQNLPELLRYKSPTTGQTPGLETTKAVPEAARGMGDTRVRIVDFLDSLRQGLPAETEARNLRQQLAQIERQSQQEVSPRELQGMLVKLAKPELSNKERGLLRLVGENQATIMADPAARMTVARWLASDVGQGIGEATQGLRKYFGIAPEQAEAVNPTAKALGERSAQIEKEYAAARQAIDKVAADAGIPMQSLANTIQRLQVQAQRAKAAVEKAEPEARGGAKPALTRLANLQGAYNTLLQRVSEASAKYDTKIKETLSTSEEMKAAKGRMRKAEDAKNLLDTINDSDSGGARHDARNALDKLMPLNVQAETKAEAPADASVAEMQEDMFPAERKQAVQREETQGMYEDLFGEQKPTVAETRAEKQKESSKERKLTGDLSALLGKQISFEKRRAMLAAIDEAPLKRQALEDAINDANLSQAERDAAQVALTAYVAKLRKRAEDKDASYATAYKLRGEESAKTQELKKQSEAPGLTEAKRAGLQARYRKAKDQLVKRDTQLARLRGVEISPIETSEQRLKTLEQLARETYKKAVSEEEQEQLDKTKGRAGVATVKATQPTSVLRTGRADQVGLLDKDKDTYTRPDLRVTEKRAPKQRNVEISKEEMELANAAKQDAPVILTKQEQAFVAYRDQVDAAISKVSDLSAKLSAVKERQEALEKQRPSKEKVAAGVTSPWTEEKAEALAYQQKSIQTELNSAKNEWARITSRESAAAGVESVAEKAQQTKINKYTNYIKELRKSVPANQRDQERVIYGGVRMPVSEALIKASVTLKSLKEDLAVGSLPGETGKTKLSNEAKSDAKLLRGTSGLNDTPLSGANVDLLTANDLTTVLENISKQSANPVAKRIAAKLAAVIEANGVTSRVVEKTTRDAPNAPGMTTADGMRVVVNENTGLSEETVIHESAHAATMFELEKPDSELTPDQRKAKAELTRMMERVKANADFDNVVIKDGDLHEFVAEGLGSRAVQAQMREDTWDGRSLWRRFIDAILRFVGVKTPPQGPMLDRFLDLAETFIQSRDAVSVAQNSVMAKAATERFRNAGEEFGLFAKTATDMLKGVTPDFSNIGGWEIGKFGPVENAFAYVWGDSQTGLTLSIGDLDLLKAGNKASKATVERFFLIPSKPGNWETAEVHTGGVPPSSSAAVSKYRESLRRVKVPGFGVDPYLKFDEGSFSKTDIRAAFRTLRTVASEMGLLKDTKALTIKRATGANPGGAPRTVLNATQIARFRSVGSLLGPKDVKYANPGLAAAGEIGDTFVAKQRGAIDRVRAAAGGFLGLETQLVDRFAPLDRISKGMEALKGMQMMSYLRMYDQRMNFTAQSVTNGALQRIAIQRKDGRTEYVIESVDGANIQQVVDILKKAPAGSPDAANRLFTLYLAGIRAKNKGFSTLHFGDKLTEAQLDSAMASIRATPGLEENFKQAREVYNEYNRNMIRFLEQSGAISKELAARLTKENDYIPFYRERNGAAELLIGGEAPIRIGSIAEQPYLHELVGGDRPILDFLTSSVQNTAMITDMGLRNLALKNAMNELEDIGLAQIRQGPGVAGPDVVRFKVEGKDYHAIVDTDKKTGIPADLLVKGLQGIPTQLPAVLRVLGMPATLIRRAVTLSPVYPARQLFRDSLAAPLLSGADFVPVLGALKEIGKSATKSTLEKRGVTGGQVFAGGSSSEAMTKILNDMLTGRGFVGTQIARAEALNMEADAATRRAQYNSYIKQGLSEMEATLMALESMNFNKRGASPSIHMVNALIPFFNSQIQGLNVLYKALTGKLPFNDRLKIQEKLLTRGAMLAAGSLAYAAMMQDDEAYKNATPEQKYGNWFVRFPGVDEPIKLPIPFEIGYFFKALPEALYNSMANEHGSEEAFKAFKAILLQTIPGGTSYGVPQALKPAIEYGMGKSFYTGRDTVSRREQQLLPEQQFRENTSEVSKMLGSGLGLSPIKIDALVQGYTGTMGAAFLQAISMGIPASESPEKTTKRLSDMPVFGTSFQPNDAGGIINDVYERMLDAKKVQASVKDLMKKGQMAEARELVSRHSEEFAQAGMADHFVSRMQKITQFENAIRASDKTGDEKRELLDKTRQMKIRLAEMVRKATDEAKSVG